jgi:hypothetical protein
MAKAPKNVGSGDNETSSEEEVKLGKYVDEVFSILKTLSIKQKKAVLTMVGSAFSVRLVPTGIPIGGVVPRSKQDNSPAKPERGPSGQQPKALYKKDPKWIKLAKDRETIVSLIKKGESGMIPVLRSKESEMKTFRSSFRA